MESPIIEAHVREEILRRLRAAEAEHDVRVLFACESGSRAWGFASADSDYDVRFIYARPAEWYLSFDVENRRDVIEYPIVDEIDCSGWDIRKALHLFTRTNGALLEWLVSPIVYIDTGRFREGLLSVAPRASNHVALCYHYSHMARRHEHQYLSGDRVKLKKYFYILRPLLAIRYLEATGELPPIEFERLVEAVAPDAIRPGIAHLLHVKRNAPEIGMGQAIPAINDFIAAEIERHGDAFRGQGRPDLLTGETARQELNTLFRAVLAET